MKLFNASLAPSLPLLTALAIMATTVACSKNSSTTVNSSMPASASLRADARQPGTNGVAPAAVAAAANAPTPTSSVDKPAGSKLITYKSRDYGISFLYPRQYAFLSARTIAQGDASLRPKSDGHDGQITLARVEIPKGFYDGTDYESGYFTLSLDQGMNQQECQASLVVPEGGKLSADTINGVEFQWIETEGGGHGHAAKQRQYVTFKNSTCYEVEMGVNTRNEDGLAREVDPDKVLRRLDGILRTVKVLPEKTPATAKPEGSTDDSKAVSHD